MYEGEFKKDKFDGKGVKYFDNKEQEVEFDGIFENNEFVKGLENKYIEGVKITLLDNLDITMNIKMKKYLEPLTQKIDKIYYSPEYPPGLSKTIKEIFESFKNLKLMYQNN